MELKETKLHSDTPAREIFTVQQPFLPRESGLTEKFAEGSGEFLRPASRYRCPLPLIDRVSHELKKTLAELGFANFFLENKIHNSFPQWQIILDYLYESSVITTPKVLYEEPFNDEPKIFLLRLLAAVGKEPTDGHTSITPNFSRGMSFDFEEALSKVVGEFLERYPLTLYRRKHLVRASTRALTRTRKHFLDIFALAGFTDQQKELRQNQQFDEATEFSWVEGVELLSGHRALIPAQLAFWNYDLTQEPQEPQLREQNTNGAAGHFSREEAILASLYELIQRDAFLIYWLNWIPPKRITLDTIDDKEVQRLIGMLARYRMEIIILNTTSDLIIPSCVCILLDTSGTLPKISLGGGCDTSFTAAIKRSIIEALSLYHWLRESNEPFSLPENYQPFSDNSIDQRKRLILWSNEKMFAQLQPFLAGPKQSFADAQKNTPKTLHTAREELARLQQLFQQKGAGYEIYVYEANHRILKTLSYHSVKTVVPALTHLYIREGNASLGGRRLREVPLALGHQPAPEFPIWPHPFP